MKRPKKPATDFRSYEAERRAVEQAPGLLPPAIRPLVPLSDQSELFDVGPAAHGARQADGARQTEMF